MKTKLSKMKKYFRVNNDPDYDIYYMLYLTQACDGIREEASDYTFRSLHNNLKFMCPWEYDNDSHITLTNSKYFPGAPIFKNLRSDTSAIALCQCRESEIEDSYLMGMISKVITNVREKYAVKIMFTMMDKNELLSLTTADPITNRGLCRGEPYTWQYISIDPTKYLTQSVESACISIINVHNVYRNYDSDTIGKTCNDIISIIHDAYKHGANAVSIPGATIKITGDDDKELSKRKVGILAHLILAIKCVDLLSDFSKCDDISESTFEKYDESEENISDEEDSIQ